MARRRRRKKRKYSKEQIISIVLFLLIVFFIEVYNGNIKLDNLFDTVKNVNEKEKPASKTLDGLEVYYIDVGQADSVLIRTTGENMLIDAGNNEDGNTLVNYFKSLDITKFNYVVGTHPHEDHIGGLDNIIKNFDIDTFFIPNVFTTTRTFEEVLDALDSKGLKFKVPEVDKEYTLGEAKFKVLYLGEDDKDLNDTSIVIKLTYGETSYLFTGDASTKVEKKLLNKDIKSDVLKLGHHGSKYSSSSDFLFKVNPKYAIASCGDSNMYHHPHTSILKKLKENNIKLYRTDKDGTIISYSDGVKIKFKTEKSDKDGK